MRTFNKKFNRGILYSIGADSHPHTSHLTPHHLTSLRDEIQKKNSEARGGRFYHGARGERDEVRWEIWGGLRGGAAPAWPHHTGRWASRRHGVLGGPGQVSPSPLERYYFYCVVLVLWAPATTTWWKVNTVFLSYYFIIVKQNTGTSLSRDDLVPLYNHLVTLSIFVQ